MHCLYKDTWTMIGHACACMHDVVYYVVGYSPGGLLRFCPHTISPVGKGKSLKCAMYTVLEYQSSYFFPDLLMLNSSMTSGCYFLVSQRELLDIKKRLRGLICGIVYNCDMHLIYVNSLQINFPYFKAC